MDIKKFCQAIIDGKQLQKSSGGIKWDNCTPEYAMHIYYMGHPNIRTKPASKTIDLTVLIDSGIDCEFSDSPTFEQTAISPLLDIGCQSDFPYTSTTEDYKYCRPRMNHVHAWAGGECPLPEGVKIEITLRSNKKSERTCPPNLNWNHLFHHSDIIAFKVLGLAGEWEWPWESDK